MSGHGISAEAHVDVPTKKYFYVWFWLLGLTLVEVYLAYIHFTTIVLLLLLMGLSITKAGIIMAYFMHLKFERMSLILTIVPAMVICISLLGIFFPDSLRLLELRK